MPKAAEKTLKEAFADDILETVLSDGELCVRPKPDALVPVCRMLRESFGFDYLADIAAVDWQDRIEVIYRLTALASNEKVVIRVDLDRSHPEIDSVTGIWKGAEFPEREAFDLMGVVFRGHPDLRRILLPEDWEGHPLRKDYVIPDQD